MTSFTSFFFIAGAILAGIGVMAGAFGAHGLEASLSEEMMDIWEKAVFYHFFHALALLVVSWASEQWGGTAPVISGWLFLFGILVFSGSLYTLALTEIKVLGAITPIGGVAMIAGWFVLAYSAL